MNNNIKIENYDITQPTLTATAVQLSTTVELYNRATVGVAFYDTTDPLRTVFVGQKTVVIEGDEYTAWGNSDSYLEDLVFEKLGIVKKA
jgi:hypothetical protein